MAVGTLNLISNHGCWAFVIVFFIAQHGLSFSYEDAGKSMFPLIPGSYWITQDTFFTGEAELIATEGTDRDGKETTIDSVKQLIDYQGGQRVFLCQRTSRKKSKTIGYELFVDSTGIVHDVESMKNGTIKIGLPVWRMYPSKDDTVYQYGIKNEPLVYNGVSLSGEALLLPGWKSINEVPIYKFAKGVGLVGQVYSGNATRLIEYRIGKGPVVKKHWVMEKPPERP